MCTNQTPATGVANKLIDELTPGQRAALHQALIIYRIINLDEKAEVEHSQMQQPVKDRCNQFYDYQVAQVNELLSQLFAFVHLDDLDPVKQFVLKYPHLKPMRTAKAF